MHTFDNQQTFTPATTADFDYDLFDIITPKKIGDTVIADNGDTFEIYAIDYVPCYYDVDCLLTQDNTFTFKNTRGIMQVVKVRRLYKNNFENQIYRKERCAFTIRIK